MEEEAVGSVDALLCSFLMMLCMFAAYLTKKFQFIYLPESVSLDLIAARIGMRSLMFHGRVGVVPASALLLGVAFGGVAKLGFDAKSLRFSPLVFFYGLLPIIIFNAGYSLKKKDFFRNFTTIVLFAVVGTIISTLVYGLCTYFLFLAGLVTHMTPGSPLLESLMFGSLISAIDPVATLSIFQDISVPTALYNLVFGESLVNDAVAIVLFHTFESFLDKEFTMGTIGIAIVQFCVISVASIALGFAVSLVCALILKNIDTNNEFCKFELAFILLSAYVAYGMADIMGLSGIMALFFCGVCNSHYGYYNTSESSKISSKYAFEALAFMAEVFTFAYLGMQVVFLQHQLDAGLLISAIPLCLLSRAVNVFPLSWLANKGRRSPISNAMKVMIWMCGLRGPIAYALCINMPTKNSAIETTTLFIVVTTTLGFGILTAPVAKSLGVTSNSVGNGTIPPLGHREQVDIFEQVERVSTRSTLHRVFKWFDRVYLKPFFGGREDGDIREPLNGVDASGDDSSSDGRREGELEGELEGLSDDDESFKYPDVTLFEMPPPVASRSGQRELFLEGSGPPFASKSGRHPLLQ